MTDEDGDFSLLIDENPPRLLLEDDDEIQLEIVEPILEEIIRKCVDKSEGLQHFTELDEEETETEKDQNLIKSIILSCVGNAIQQAKKSGKSLELLRNLYTILRMSKIVKTRISSVFKT